MNYNKEADCWAHITGRLVTENAAATDTSPLCPVQQFKAVHYVLDHLSIFDAIIFHHQIK